jgi:hypothetical protein
LLPGPADEQDVKYKQFSLQVKVKGLNDTDPGKDSVLGSDQAWWSGSGTSAEAAA